MTTKPTEAQLEADRWNSRYPIGMPVEVTRDGGEKSLTCTRSIAWEVCGQAVVLLEGITGGYHLSRVRACEKQMEFFEAVHADLTMKPEDKIYWLYETCKHLNSLLKGKSIEGGDVMTVRAKFTVVKVQPFGTEEYPMDGGSVILAPVYSEDPNHENKAFWDATPSGTIEMNINNPKAFGQFELGKEYYIDFTPAPAG
ncbi:MAG TPA: hypothetical protein PK416_08895 [Thermodesulfobacteriota bacterium]|nr:hypothetical protein [Thermodesulfobacteriota bacterium]